MAADVVYVANLDDSQVLKALQNIDKNIDRLAKEASDDFDKIGKAAKQSGVSIGVMSGVVSSLITEFINLGKQAINVLVDIGKQSVQTAIEMDTLKARLGGIFDGSKEAADEAFTFIQDKSKELGIDLSELAGAFLPKTESLAQFERVAKIATALARSDPEQGAIGARIALIEALSGTFTSLQRRFEIPKDDINQIKEAFDKKGIEGFLTTLEDVLNKSGKSFEDLANTAQTSFNKLAIAGQQIGGRLGTPIVESLEKASNKILDFVNANEDEIIVFADTIGRAIGDAIDFLTNIDLSQLDTSQLIQVADTIYQIVQAVQTVIPELANFISGVGLLASNLPVVSQTLDGLGYILGGIDEAFITLVQILGLVNAELAAFSASSNKAAIGLDLVQAGLSAASLNYVDVIKQLQEVQGKLNADTDANSAFNDSIAISNKNLQEYRDSLTSNQDAQNKLRDTLKEQKEAGTDAADSILALAQAQKELEEEGDKAAGAQAQIDKALADAALDNQRKLEDIDIQTERKRLDIQIEFAQKREDAATDNLRKLEDIREKYADDVSDANLDLERKEEDIARKFGEERIDQERERRTKRLDIERDYRLKLQDIQRQFLLDAQEAEEKRDAVSFIRALKERDKKVQDAQLDRSTEIQELRISNQQKTEELRLQQQRELEEAQIANERKLEDLRTNLNRQIEEQNENYNQQLADIGIAEARKNEELNTWREREIEDAKLAYDRKLEDLKTSLADELAIIEEFGQKKLELMQQIADAQSAIAAQSVSAQNTVTGAGSQSGSSYYSSRQGGINNQRQQSTYASSRQGGINSIRQGKASGGNVFAGGTYPVGERGMELFTPNQSGRIIPNSALTMPNFGGSSAIHNVTTNNNQSASLGGLLDPNSLDAILSAKVQNMLLGILDKMG